MLLGVIVICGATVVSNIFFPNKEKIDNTEEVMVQPDGRGAKPFLHPTMKVRFFLSLTILHSNQGEVVNG